MLIPRIPKPCMRPLRFNQSRRASASDTSFRLIIVAAPISKFTAALVARARARHNLPTFGHCRGDVGYWFLTSHSCMRRVCFFYNGMIAPIIFGVIQGFMFHRAFRSARLSWTILNSGRILFRWIQYCSRRMIASVDPAFPSREIKFGCTIQLSVIFITNLLFCSQAYCFYFVYW